MTLSIYDELSDMNSRNSNNPYALNAQEVAQMKAWDTMSDDDQGEYLFSAKQQVADQDYIQSKGMFDYINGNDVQRLASGGAVVGGQLRPDALVSIGGMEMTVQQAIDHGIYSSDVLGQQVADGDQQVEDQAGLLAGISPSEITVNKYGQVLTQDFDGSVWMYDEAINDWVEAELDK